MTKFPTVRLFGWRKVAEKPIPLDGTEVLEFRVGATDTERSDTFLAYYDPAWGNGRGCWFYQHADKAIPTKRIAEVTNWRPTGIKITAENN